MSYDETLSVIAQYLCTSEPDVALSLTESKEFNPLHRKYIITRLKLRTLIDGLTTNDLVSKSNIDEIYSIFGANFENVTKEEVANNCIIISFLENLLLRNDKESAIKVITELENDLIRENLSVLLVDSDVTTPFLTQINFIDIKSIKESRDLLVDNLVNLTGIKIKNLKSLLNNITKFNNLAIPKSLPDKLKFKLNYHNDEIWCLKYSPNGEYLATGSKDCKILVFDTSNNYKILNIFEAHSESVTFLSWSNDSNYLLSLSFDQTLRIWDIKFDKCIFEMDNKTASSNLNSDFLNNSRFSATHFMPDFCISNNILISSNDGKLVILNIKSNKIVKKFENNLYYKIQIIDFIVQNDKIFAITLNNELVTFDLNLKLMNKFDLNFSPVSVQSVSTTFSSHPEHYLLVNSKPNSLALINIKGDDPYLETKFMLPTSSANNFIIRGTAGGYELESSNNNKTISIEDSNLLVLSGGKTGDVWMWAGLQGNVVGKVSEHEGLVNCVDWRNQCTNGEWASGSDDGKICVFGTSI